MRRSKLLRFLASLPPEEFKRLSKAIRKACGPDSQMGTLWIHLCKYYPFQEKHPKLSKEHLLKKVLRTELNAANKKRLANLSSLLYEEVLHYYFRERLKTDEAYRDDLELFVLRRFKLDELYYQKANTTRGKLTDRSASLKKYQLLTNLESNLYYYSATEKMINKVPGLVAYNQHLEQYYRIAKLRYLCEVASRNNIIRSGATPEQPDFIQHPDDTSELQQEDQLLEKLYAEILTLNRNYDPDLYHELKAFLWQHWPSFHQEDGLILLTYLINFCTKRFKTGSAQDLREIFDLYKFGAASQLIVESGLVTADNFRNAVFSACGVRDFAWAERFVRDFGKFLPARLRLGIIDLVRARIAFGKEDFEQVIDLIVRNHQVGFSNKLLAKYILSQAYYELGDSKMLLLRSHIKSFETFLNRDKLHHGNTTLACKNFLQVLKLLIRDKNKLSKTIILKRLNNVQIISGKAWLNEKIAALPK